VCFHASLKLHSFFQTSITLLRHHFQMR